MFNSSVFFLILCFVFISCSNNSTEEKNNPTSGKLFFNYDEIDYYTINYTESQLPELTDNWYKSELDSLKLGVIIQHIPNSITDTLFIEKLGAMGYTKKLLSKNTFSEIDNLFSEKPVKDSVFAGCLYIFRDILIFKKNNKTIGTAKICFGCGANDIKGAAVNPNGFGQNGEYKELEKILKR